jgi:hypothetical protein
MDKVLYTPKQFLSHTQCKRLIKKDREWVKGYSLKNNQVYRTDLVSVFKDSELSVFLGNRMQSLLSNPVDRCSDIFHLCCFVPETFQSWHADKEGNVGLTQKSRTIIIGLTSALGTVVETGRSAFVLEAGYGIEIPSTVEYQIQGPRKLAGRHFYVLIGWGLHKTVN